MPRLTIQGADPELSKRLLASWSPKASILCAPVKVEFVQKPIRSCQDALWYGGTVARVVYQERVFELCASGCVEVLLYSLNGPETPVVWVRDRLNLGEFRTEMRRYCSTDRALRTLRRGQHAKYRLELRAENRWECLSAYPGTYLEHLWTADSRNMLCALSQILDRLAIYPSRAHRSA